MNDPNGPIHHGGWYHLFFQHDPSRHTWGRMHWGHARSRDLVRWELLPHALTPAEAQDEDHCFSGCAWRDRSGRPLLFYTSVRGDHERYVTEQWAVRASDALDEFHRVEENPVVGSGSASEFISAFGRRGRGRCRTPARTRGGLRGAG